MNSRETNSERMQHTETSHELGYYHSFYSNLATKSKLPDERIVSLFFFSYCWIFSPKNVSFEYCWLATNTLSSFKSLWATSFWCKSAKPFQIYIATHSLICLNTEILQQPSIECTISLKFETLIYGNLTSTNFGRMLSGF